MSGRIASLPDRKGSPIVTCSEVVREYRRGAGPGWIRRDKRPVVKAIDGVSLSIFPGKLVGIAGPSGSGKSTLLHLMAALDLPTSGAVQLVGHATHKLSKRERARFRLDHVGIVFQHFHLIPSLSARSNVALPLVEYGIDKQTRRTRATKLLGQFGLQNRIDHKPAALSGGEQQRVAIARALVTEPDLIVADEPTGEVDNETGAKILDLFEEIAVDRAVVLASHDRRALERADRLIRLQDGQLLSNE